MDKSGFAFNTVNEQVNGGWVLDGQKRWIGNSTFADILIIFAQNTAENQINAYFSLFLYQLMLSLFYWLIFFQWIFSYISLTGLL